MREYRTRAIAIGLVSIALLYLFGCILDPKEDVVDQGNGAEYGDLSKKEHCIENLQIAYDRKDINAYKDLLRSDRYIWYNQTEDQAELGDFMNYDQDVEGTEYLFDNVTTMDMDLTPHTWDEVDSLGSSECPGCWQISVSYKFDVMMKSMDHYAGDDIVDFIVQPFTYGSDTRYKIIYAQDRKI